MQHTLTRLIQYMNMIRSLSTALFGAISVAAVFIAPNFVFAEHVQACTMEYAPVCGERDVVCVRAPCPPIQETFGNKCALDAAHARFLYGGECRGGGSTGSPTYPTPSPLPLPPDTPGNDYPSYEPPKNCTAWFDGCNSCSRGENGMAMCTLRACIGTPASGYCTRFASDTAGGTSAEDRGYTPEASCRSWFDGCNTCRRMEDGGAACTKKFCAEPEGGYCMDYDDTEYATSSEPARPALPASVEERGRAFFELVHTFLKRLFSWTIL